MVLTKVGDRKGELDTFREIKRALQTTAEGMDCDCKVCPSQEARDVTTKAAVTEATSILRESLYKVCVKSPERGTWVGRGWRGEEQECVGGGL